MSRVWRVVLRKVVIDLAEAGIIVILFGICRALGWYRVDVC